MFDSKSIQTFERQKFCKNKLLIVKFDSQLASYLSEYKSLKLEGIGEFTLPEKSTNEQEKELHDFSKDIVFTYNPKSVTDEEVVFLLVKKLNKIEPLIRSDLESYLSNIKAFLNIGNPYTIEGIGTLIKNDLGKYEFTPGDFLPVKEELYAKRENAGENYPLKSKSAAARVLVTILIVISAIAAVSGISWAIINFSVKSSSPDKEILSQERMDTIAQADTTESLINKASVLKDTAPIRPDEQAVLAPPIAKDSAAADSVTYKMVFEVTKSKERARSRTAQLNNLHSFAQYDSIPINDSVAYYRLFLKVKINPVDTARVKDSLRVLLKEKIFMETAD